MSDPNKRGSPRKQVQITTYIRKELPAGGYTLMQFVSKDLSEGGIFISTDDLSLFDLGEVLSVIVDREKKRLFEGRAKVVRSVRTFESAEVIPESGFGLMFTRADSGFSEMIKEQLSRMKDEAI